MTTEDKSIEKFSAALAQNTQTTSSKLINKADYDRTLIGIVVEKTTKPNIIGAQEITDGTWLWLIQCADASYYIENYKANITAVGQRVRLYIPNHDFTEKYAEVIEISDDSDDIMPIEITKVNSNKVIFIYSDKKVTWEADGTGNTRSNFRKTVEEIK